MYIWQFKQKLNEIWVVITWEQIILWCQKHCTKGYVIGLTFELWWLWSTKYIGHCHHVCNQQFSENNEIYLSYFKGSCCCIVHWLLVGGLYIVKALQNNKKAKFVIASFLYITYIQHQWIYIIWRKMKFPNTNFPCLFLFSIVFVFLFPQIIMTPIFDTLL